MNENKDFWFWLICILCFTVFLAMSYLGLRYVVRRHIMKDEIVANFNENQ